MKNIRKYKSLKDIYEREQKNEEELSLIYNFVIENMVNSYKLSYIRLSILRQTDRNFVISSWMISRVSE